MKIDKSRIKEIIKGNENLRIAVVVSNFNKSVTDKLLKGALLALKKNKIKDKNIEIYRVPGSFEIPVVTANLCRVYEVDRCFDGIITLGCIIKGETAHFEYIAESASNTLSLLSTKQNIPIGFGILTCYTKQQASDRCKINPINSDGNKGYECALSVLETIRVLKRIKNFNF